ncbi:hypothetical protein DASC09_041630 [Saccharomycopsis crataegensis]|uniref:Homing endonuclease LAGLIDADG domain-containing protein n=1 Tax=Saccharomycopsis crataegensis TaxID=43959 RepID=A0AAV5QRS0_9ASCO|nr:hypothetical protein DASC09_041630 [Saccharomycopsis crataegensis]
MKTYASAGIKDTIWKKIKSKFKVAYASDVLDYEVLHHYNCVWLNPEIRPEGVGSLTHSSKIKKKIINEKIRERSLGLMTLMKLYGKSVIGRRLIHLRLNKSFSPEELTKNYSIYFWCNARNFGLDEYYWRQRII